MNNDTGRKRAVVEGVWPEVDCGKYPAKRCIDDVITVEADIFTDGHDSLSAVLLYRPQTDSVWSETPMTPSNNDRWQGEFKPTELGTWIVTIEAWVDAFLTWRRDLEKRVAADQDTPIDYLIGANLIERVDPRAAASLRSNVPIAERRIVALNPDLASRMARSPDRSLATRYRRELPIVVDPTHARFSAWYEFFPRSAANDPNRHGTFKDCESWLPYIAKLGFDVVYLPPIHPIGNKFRKGKNNTVEAEPGDVGSPWAIGGPEGGHKSIHPELGDLESFRSLVNAAGDFNLRVAIDIAFQASPDHPYVVEHPEWFRSRPDGTIQYAENPPKKYQDIYPFDFESEDWENMWSELKSVFLFWIEQGVRIFRVDNPHTKAFAFWEWCIAEIKRDYPDVLFLSEAFTRPKVMYRLAKVGFSQSYTYFPWRHTKREFVDYFSELTKGPVREYFRGNHWPNTPDILTEFLQASSATGFKLRFLLASTLGASYGIYGPAFEHCISEPLRHGSEEYLYSEKYQIRQWQLDQPGTLAGFIAQVNHIRRENQAFQNDLSLRFHEVDNDQLICFTKQSADASNVILVVINLDPNHTHAGYVELPVAELGIDSARPYQVHELLTGTRQIWHGSRTLVEVNPSTAPGQIFHVQRRVRTEQQFEYFL